MLLTWMIIGMTCIASVMTMNDPAMKMRYMFNAYAISKHNQWYRFLTHGLLHADFAHLFFNMLSLYFFGRNVERVFKSEELFGAGLGTAYYLLLYVGGLIVSSIYSFFKHRENMHYNALGASGAVSAVVYASILLFPTSTIYFWVIPIQSWMYGIIYLAASWYMARKQVGNIGHDAHFWGAVYGFLLPLCFRPDLWTRFLFELKMKLFYHV